MMESSNINFHYDKDADVLYVRMGKQRDAIYEDSENGIIYRIDPATKQYFGFTITHYMKRIKKGMLKEVPHFEWINLPRYN